MDLPKRGLIWEGFQRSILAEENAPFLDTNACSVHALANAAEMPCEEAYTILQRFGRRDGHGYEHFAAWANYFFERLDLPKPLVFHRFLQQYPRGNYMLGVRGHVFAIRDAQTLDFAPCSAQKRVFIAWQVTAPAVWALRAYIHVHFERQIQVGYGQATNLINIS